MAIHVNIERLILTGLPIGPHDAPRLTAAIRQEVARLLSEQVAAGARFTSDASPTRGAPTIQLSRGALPADIGRQIAGSVIGGIRV